jgi:hypothetical protein
MQNKGAAQNKKRGNRFPIAPLFSPDFSTQSPEWVPRIYLPELSPRDGSEFKFERRSRFVHL